MTQRLDFHATTPQAIAVLLQQEAYLRQRFSEQDEINLTIWELLKLRVSQINQCAYCIDMHSKDAIALGETPQRLYGLNAWRDMPFYTQAERDALTWAELLTGSTEVTDPDYQQALQRFGPTGLVDLTLAVNAINAWNRMVRAFKPQAGHYQVNRDTKSAQ